MMPIHNKIFVVDFDQIYRRQNYLVKQRHRHVDPTVAQIPFQRAKVSIKVDAPPHTATDLRQRHALYAYPTL